MELASVLEEIAANPASEAEEAEQIAAPAESISKDHPKAGGRRCQLIQTRATGRRYDNSDEPAGKKRDRDGRSAPAVDAARNLVSLDGDIS